MNCSTSEFWRSGKGSGDSWAVRSPAILTPTTLPGSCVRIVGSCLRTSCCRLESSPSSGRTWVCPGGPEGRVLEGWVFGSTPWLGWWQGMETGELGWSLHPPAAGRMYLFYGNKTSVQFQSFSPTVVHPGDLQTHILCFWPRECPPHPCSPLGSDTQLHACSARHSELGTCHF